MESFKLLVKKHPVVVFYFITFLISWGGLVLVLGGLDKISSQSTTVPFLPLYLVTVAGPFITGVLLTGLYDGKKGYREFLSRLLKWRVSLRWYAAALLIAPFTVFTTLFVLSLISPVFIPGIFSSGDNPIASAFGLNGSDKMALLLFVFMLGLFNGIVEEVGWTGFVTPKIRVGHSLILSGLIVGIMWGLWHFLSNYLGSAAAGPSSLMLYMSTLLFSFLPPFRLLMMWVYDHSKSLLIAILMHASLDIFWIISTPNVLTGNERMIWYITWAVILWVVTIICFVLPVRALTSRRDL